MNRNEQTMFNEIIEMIKGQPYVNQVVVENNDPSELKIYVEIDEVNNNCLKLQWELDEKMVDKWHHIHESVYDKIEEQKNPFTGWISTFTRKPFPTQEMEEWVECTVKRILALNPKNVFEIGVGKGLLLEKTAPKCSRYVGIDFCKNVIEYLKSQFSHDSRFKNVSLFQSNANQFENILKENQFDTIIINSVVQYFPNIDYLIEVIEKSLAVLSLGGKIFIGDVRSLDLINLFFISLFNYQGKNIDFNLLENSLKDQTELIISGHFFHDLNKKFPQIHTIHIEPKQEANQNELTKFRYDVTIYTGLEQPKNEFFFDDWRLSHWTLPQIEQILKNQTPDHLAISHISNKNLTQELKTLFSLAHQNESYSDGGIAPNALIETAKKWGYSTKLSLNRCDCNGSYDAILFPINSKFVQKNAIIKFPGPQDLIDNTNPLANDPQGKFVRQKCIEAVLNILKTHLPDNKLKKKLIVIDKVRFDANGNVDEKTMLEKKGDLRKFREIVF